MTLHLKITRRLLVICAMFGKPLKNRTSVTNFLEVKVNQKYCDTTRQSFTPPTCSFILNRLRITLPRQFFRNRSETVIFPQAFPNSFNFNSSTMCEKMQSVSSWADFILPLMFSAALFGSSEMLPLKKIESVVRSVVSLLPWTFCWKIFGGMRLPHSHS